MKYKTRLGDLWITKSREAERRFGYKKSTRLMANGDRYFTGDSYIVYLYFTVIGFWTNEIEYNDRTKRRS